jgi:hypothetical protein
MSYAKAKQTSQGYEFYSSYDAGLVQSLKYEIPANMRRWNPDKKCWLIDDSQLPFLKQIVQDHFGIALRIEHMPKQTAKLPSTRLIRVEYIGQIKDRGNGELSAYGAVLSQKFNSGLEWPYVFSELTLKKWFLGNNAKDTVNTSTYYTVLSLKQNTPQNEIKKAWRKMAKRYHPDINSDDDATKMMQMVNDAYNILRNPQKRKKYDAGLKLQSSLTASNRLIKGSDFTIPVRCGMILAKGHDRVGRFVIDEILEWTDIVENGRSLVTSWDLNTNSLRREWV